MARALKDGTIVLNAEEVAIMKEREAKAEKKGGPDRPRRRAAERNEKTDSITKERRRIRELEAEVQELREWKAARIEADDEDLLRAAELLDPDED